MLSNFYICISFEIYYSYCLSANESEFLRYILGVLVLTSLTPLKNANISFVSCGSENWYRSSHHSISFCCIHQSADRWFYNRTLFKILITTKCFCDVNFYTWYFADKLPTFSTKIYKGFTYRRKPFIKSYKLKLKNLLPLRFSYWYLYLNHFWFGP